MADITTEHWKLLVDGMTDEQCAKITEICIQVNRLHSLPGLERFVNLKVLDCSRNRLTHLDGLDKLTHLSHLYCYDNDFQWFPDCTPLEQLEIVSIGQHWKLPIDFWSYGGIFFTQVGINALRRITCRHHRIRTQVIPAVVATLGVAKRRRAIRDVLGLVVKMIWRMR